jgi:hypothetical protein
MGDDRFYEAWKRENPDLNSKQLERLFIERNWHNCIGSARRALVAMLTDSSVGQHLKEEVFDVLVKDRSLVRGRGDYVGRA